MLDTQLRFFLLHTSGAQVSFALYLTAQAPNNGVLTFDGFVHAPELFGIGLLEFDANAFGGLDQFGSRSLQHFAVGGVGKGLGHHGAVNNHRGQLLLGDELQGDCHVDGAGQRLFYTVFTQRSPKPHRQR